MTTDTIVLLGIALLFLAYMAWFVMKLHLTQAEADFYKRRLEEEIKLSNEMHARLEALDDRPDE